MVITISLVTNGWILHYSKVNSGDNSPAEVFTSFDLLRDRIAELSDL